MEELREFCDSVEFIKEEKYLMIRCKIIVQNIPCKFGAWDFDNNKNNLLEKALKWKKRVMDRKDSGYYDKFNVNSAAN